MSLTPWQCCHSLNAFAAQVSPFLDFRLPPDLALSTSKGTNLVNRTFFTLRSSIDLHNTKYQPIYFLIINKCTAVRQCLKIPLGLSGRKHEQKLLVNNEKEKTIKKLTTFVPKINLHS
jgi:hypothetical protein